MAAAPARRAPARRPAPARRGAPARRAPARKPQAKRKPVPLGARLLDRLLYGRGWIGLVFVLLAGIVFFNVDLLQMNRGIAETSNKADAVKRENARLRTELARLGSSERIQRVAVRAGLVLPAPGEVRYLRATPSADASRAAKRIKSGEASAPASAEIPPAKIQETQVQPAQPQVAAPQATTPQTPALQQGPPAGQ
jgi:cell division protein FtsL